jgi:hypothetical protein
MTARNAAIGMPSHPIGEATRAAHLVEACLVLAEVEPGRAAPRRGRAAGFTARWARGRRPVGVQCGRELQCRARTLRRAP